MEEVTIKKMPIWACKMILEHFEQLWDMMHNSETKCPRNVIEKVGWTILDMKENIRIATEEGRDYIYLKGDAVLKYELGDRLFSL